MKESNESLNKCVEDLGTFYTSINLTKKDKFAKACNKLLNENFIYGQLSNDKEDYYTILELREAIDDYFKLLDYSLRYNDEHKIFYLVNDGARNRVQLKKLETILLLEFRLFYLKKSKEASSQSNIVVNMDEVLVELNKTGIYQKEPNKGEIFSALTTLRRRKIINMQANQTDFDKANNIEIYPTILLVVDNTSIDNLIEKINSYKAKEEEDESYEN